jgi:hypothetical protein
VSPSFITSGLGFGFSSSTGGVQLSKNVSNPIFDLSVWGLFALL